MPIRSVTLRILGDSKDALDKMRLVNAEADKLEKRRVKVNVGVDIDNNDIVAVKAKIAAISKLRASVAVNIDMKGLLGDFAKLKAELIALRGLSKDIRIDPGVDVRGLTVAVAELRKMGLAAQNTGASIRRLGKDTKDADSIMGSIFKRGNSGFFSLFQFLTGDVKLFAGLLGTISTFHLLFDAILEVAIVWTTAAAAAAAFGVAAIPTVDKIYDHMKNLVTVSKATGQNIYPLTGGFQRLAAAVKPQVYQIFGDALTVMNDRTGLFAKLATSAGSVLEHFAARIAVALRTGGGLSKFFDEASNNLSGLLEGFASFFHIIGSLLGVMPGYAEILLHFGDALLHVTAIVVNAAKPFIGAGLWLHGFIVWAGLGVTVTWAFGRALIFFGNRAIGTAVKALAEFVVAVGSLVFEVGIAEAAMATFTFVMDALAAVNPLVWVGIAVGALAGLAFWMSKSESATTKWGDTLQKNINSSTTIFQDLNRTETAAGLAAENLQKQQMALANTQKFMTVTNIHTGLQTKVLTGAYREQSQVVTDSRAVYQKFNDEVKFNAGRLTGLAKVYGGTSNALGLLNAAGVTTAEWQDRSASGWALINQKIQGTIAGYKAMGQSGGQLNNDLAVMDRQVDSQREAMTKLNQAWDQFIGDVTGTQQSFDTVAQGFKTLESQGVKTTQSLGKTHVTVEGLGKAIDGLTPKDIALNSAFITQIGQLNSLYDSWRSAGLAGNLFTRGVKASLQPLVKYAHGSSEATAQLIALAQEAGFSGPENLKSLVKWLGHGSNSLQIMKRASDQATTQTALLTGAMQAQGSYIANTLIREIKLTELAYYGVTQKAKDYGKAIAQYGQDSAQAQAKQRSLTNSIIEGGQATHQTTKQIAEMISKILGIPLSRAITIVEKGVGSFSVSGGGPTGLAPPGHRQAAGGLITMGTPGKDSFPALLMPGELVVPTKMVQAGVVDHLRGMLPGFAAGGLVQQGNTGVLSGQAAVSFDRNFIKTFTNAMEASMTKALKAAVAAAKAMAGAPGALGGPTSAGAAQAQAYARSRLGAYGWGGGEMGPLIALWNQESGWNRFARNPSSGAYGIPQALPPGKMGAAANPPTSSAAAQINWGLGYIKGRYGSPSGAELHERQFNWYAGGSPGAAPGWAWVGERGPELVHMLGGERVLDALTSSKITRGYASGTEGRRGAELINIFRNDQSDKSWRRDLHKYLEFINDYYNGRAKNWRDDHIRRQTRAMERAQDQLAKVNSMAKSYNQFRSAAFQSLSGYGGLSNLTIGPTAGVGDNVALSGGQGLKLQLSTKLATLKQFSAALRKLVQFKLPPALLRQIVDMGPDSGLPLAQEIISGGPAFVKALAGQEAAITEQERQISRGVGAASVGKAFDTGADFINGLRKHRRDLEDLFADLGKRMGREAVRWFNVPKSRRPKGFAVGGILTEPVWGIGASGTEYTFAENGPELISPKHLPRMGGGDTYIINVAGDSDPDGAARRIIQKVSDYKRRHGNVPTGIG